MALEYAHQPAPSMSERLSRVSTPVWVAVICAIAIAAHLSVQLTGDVSWLLTASERVRAGQQLYTEVLELNPPMSIWLYAPWTWLADHLGVRAETVLVFAVIGFALLMIAAAARTLTAAGLVTSRAWWIVAALAFALSPMSTFAQREHFAAMAALPLLATIASRAAGRTPTTGEQILAALLGGFATSIKPHFAIAIVLPALVAAWTRRSIRPLFAPELIGAAIVTAIYLAFIRSVYPEYFTEMLPLAKMVYLPNRRTIPELLWTNHCRALLFLIAATLLARWDAFSRPLFAVFAASLVGFLVVYLLQGRGWGYHLLPAMLLAMLIFGLIVAQLGGRLTLFQKLMTVALGLYLVSSPALEYLRWRHFDDPLKEAVGAIRPNPKIALISGDLSFGSPLHRELDGALVNRGPSLWLAGNAVILCLDTKDEALLKTCREAEDLDRKFLREDLEKTPADVILVGSTWFDWLGWARSDPKLARVLDGYHELEKVRREGDTLTILVPNQSDASPAVGGPS